MRVYIVDNYDEMSLKASNIIIDQLKKKPNSTLGLATGDTVLGMYQNLIAEYKEKRLSFKDVKTVNLDEYIGLPREHKNSYYYYMNENFFKHIDIDRSQTFIPNGMAEDLEEECIRFEQTIEQLGGIDLQVLGIGVNGHIGFNEPGTPIDSVTQRVKLKQSTIESNSRFFDSIEDVPTEALTMGIKTIMRSRKIILLASGEKKAKAIQRLVEGRVHPESPASILQLHPDASVILDKEAASLLTKYGRD